MFGINSQRRATLGVNIAHQSALIPTSDPSPSAPCAPRMPTPAPAALFDLGTIATMRQPLGCYSRPSYIPTTALLPPNHYPAIRPPTRSLPAPSSSSILMMVCGSGSGVDGIVSHAFWALKRSGSPRIVRNRSARLARQGAEFRFSGTSLTYSCMLSRTHSSRFSTHATLRKRCYRPIFHPAPLSISTTILASASFENILCALYETLDPHSNTPSSIISNLAVQLAHNPHLRSSQLPPRFDPSILDYITRNLARRAIC